MVDAVVLPPGYRADARLAITIMSVVGEVLQGERKEEGGTKKGKGLWDKERQTQMSMQRAAFIH